MRFTVNYPEVRTLRQRRGTCPVCGSKASRTKSFAQTVNPFHPAITHGMSPDDARRAVWKTVNQEADQWVPDFTHERCKS